MLWFFCYYKLLSTMCSPRYNIYLILFFNFHQLFPAFIRANNIESLVKSLFRVDISNPFLFFFFSSPGFSLYHSLQAFSSSIKVAGSYSGIIILLLASVLYFFQHQIKQSIYKNMFPASYYIILRLCYTNLFFSLLFLLFEVLTY